MLVLAGASCYRMEGSELCSTSKDLLHTCTHSQYGINISLWKNKICKVSQSWTSWLNDSIHLTSRMRIFSITIAYKVPPGSVDMVVMVRSWCTQICFLHGYLWVSVVLGCFWLCCCAGLFPRCSLCCSHWGGLVVIRLGLVLPALHSALVRMRGGQPPSPPALYCRDSHIHIQTHTLSNRGLFSFSTRAKHKGRRLSHGFSLLCSDLPHFASVSYFFVLLLTLYTRFLIFSYTYTGPMTSASYKWTNSTRVISHT